MLKNNQGFTLIEMLVVLMVISVLIILIVPNLNSNSENINEKGCDALTAVVQAQVDAYYIDEGSYPGSLQVLASAGYIKNEQIECPDGRQLIYSGSSGSVSSP
ncbi:competence type IV pilus major pilin ComGC [Virgibacillus sp. YIM 98842]|uniref:competence type IV pilus major pilin ComGC n=1 Tax=Virgibacillus sp. YIM 98842 TaxID=2663533 RepID=UPI0013DC1852|nr:competence type IV pilus major pilin ComGC [Virgibacillus sp. YIM 98842]